MFLKKYKIYRENSKKDYELVKKYYRAFREAENNLKEMTICNKKIFIIKADSDKEFNEKYNEFMSEISEGIKQSERFNARTTLGSIFIKNKSKINFNDNKFIVSIEYEEVEIKKKYKKEQYLELKNSLDKLKIDFEEAEKSFNRKYFKSFYEKYMSEIHWRNYLDRH